MDEKHTPDSLKYQWRIMGLVLRSRWATSLDKSIAFEIVDNYKKRHGNSRASLSYLVKATGADRKSVIASTRRLVEHGPFSVARAGVGTRPTEYNINFDLVQDGTSSGADTTTNIKCSSSGADTTTGGGVETTTRSASSGAHTTESVLHEAAYQAGLHDRMIDCAPAAPPPTVGPEGATAAGGAQGGFEELWKAYDYRQKKADAKAAYKKLAPDADLHERLIEAASQWRASWAAQDKADAPRFTLAKWIEREEFECLPPSAYKPKERKAKITARATKTDKRLSERFRIMSVEEIGSPFSDWRLRLKLENAAGGVSEHVLHVLDRAGDGPDIDLYRSIAEITESSKDWAGSTLYFEMDGNTVKRALQAPANDNTDTEAAA